MNVLEKKAVLAKVASAARTGALQKRIDAIHTLGKLDDQATVPVLVDLLSDQDARIRALAVSKLVFLKSKKAVPALKKCLGDRDAQVRQHALYALARLKEKSAADKAAELLGDDRNAVVRYNAALMLQETAALRHQAALIAALQDQDSNVVVSALKALAVIAPREVSRHTLKLLQNPKQWQRILDNQKDLVLKLLAPDVKRPEVQRYLKSIVHTFKPGGKVSMEAAEAATLLANAGIPDAIPVLRACLEGVDYSQERGVLGLQKLKDRGCVPAILSHALKNEFYPIRLKSIRALGEIGDERALPALGAFFNTTTNDDFLVDRSMLFTKDDPDLRFTSLAAMVKIAFTTLRAAVRTGDAGTKKRASAILKDLQRVVQGA